MQDWTPVVFKSKKKAPPGTKVLKKGPLNPNQPQTTYKEDEHGMPIKKEFPADFGRKMGVARNAKGWTQKELAQKLSVGLTEIQQYEQNKHPNPNRTFARRIEKVLNATLF